MSNRAAGNIIQILAGLPDFLRKPMLQRRLKEFCSMSEADRHETISMALVAAPTIQAGKLAALVKTWLEVMSEFDSEKRTMMFAIYCKQALAHPASVQKLNLKLLTDTFLSLDEKQRERIIDSLHEVLFSLPNRHELLRMIPDYSLQALRLKS